MPVRPDNASTTPAFLKHCVVQRYKDNGGDLDAAFAICVANFQRWEFLKPDSLEMTPKGVRANKKHLNEPDAASKLAEYEKILAENRGDQKKVAAGAIPETMARFKANASIASKTIMASAKKREKK